MCSNNSNVTIKGNSNVTFSSNKASQMEEPYIHTICAGLQLKITPPQPSLTTLQEIMMVLYLAANFQNLPLREVQKFFLMATWLIMVE